MQNLLSSILIAPNVINDEGVKFIIDYIKKQKKEDLSVFNSDLSNKNRTTEFSIDKKIRDTQEADIRGILPDITELYKNIVNNIINPFYNIQILDSECPQLLVYNVGGHYEPHYDGVSKWKAPTGEIIWRKCVDRDLSIVIFLNDDFTGGEFVFPDLRIKVKPEPGLMVCFPSNQHYLHGVEPVTRGTRYSIVNWMRIKGFETMEEESKKIKAMYGVC